MHLDIMLFFLLCFKLSRNLSSSRCLLIAYLWHFSLVSGTHSSNLFMCLSAMTVSACIKSVPRDRVCSVTYQTSCTYPPPDKMHISLLTSILAFATYASSIKLCPDDPPASCSDESNGMDNCCVPSPGLFELSQIWDVNHKRWAIDTIRVLS